jgi:hypothetical protein
VSEQLWPHRFREASRELSSRWHSVGERLTTPLRLSAAELQRLRFRYTEWLEALRARLRGRKFAVWVAAFAALTAIELAIAFPLLIGPSQQAFQSVDRAAEAIVSKATGEDGKTQAGAAADRGREALSKGPSGSPGPETPKPSGVLPIAGSEEASEEPSAVAPVAAPHANSAGSSAGGSERLERTLPPRRAEPAKDSSEGAKSDSPSLSPAPPQPQTPASPSVASPPPLPPPPATSTSTTTRTVALPPVVVPKKSPPPRNRRDDDEDEPKSTTTTATTTTTTTTTASPQPPPTTTTPDGDEEDEEEKEREEEEDEDEEERKGKGKGDD